MAFPRLGGLVNRAKKIANTPIRLPGMKPKVPKARPMGTSSMPINAGKRFSGGMTSGSRMPRQTFATRGQARAAVGKPKQTIATPNANAFRKSRFAPGQRMTKRRSSAGFKLFSKLINFNNTDIEFGRKRGSKDKQKRLRKKILLGAAGLGAAGLGLYVIPSYMMGRQIKKYDW